MHANDGILSIALSEEEEEEPLWHTLDDSLIDKILLHLPSFIGFLTISKPWLSLATSRYFLRRWRLQRAPFHHDPPLALLLQNSYTGTERDFFLCCGVPEVEISGFTLDFLPMVSLTRPPNYTVLGFCDDLLLCGVKEEYRSFHYVANPITRQFVRLTNPGRLHKRALHGFICEPASVAKARRGGELRYRVVCIPVFEDSMTKFNVEILSSEDGQWKNHVMTLAEELTSHSCIHVAIACNGILYWHFDCGSIKVMGLNPFNPEQKGIHVIQNDPDNYDVKSKNHVLGICRGKLRMSKMIWSDDKHQVGLSMHIWELDVGEAKWQLVHKVRLQEIIAANLSIVNPSTTVRSSWRTFAFHPCNPEIVYFYLECNETNRVICCNLQRKSLEIESGYDFNNSCGSCVDVIPFPLPQRPTGLPGRF